MADYKEDRMLFSVLIFFYLPFGSDGLKPNFTFWSRKWSCFKVSVTVIVRALFLSSTIDTSTKDA